ncbi:MAG TPA: GNAT family N-acetyltransferase [Ktedonobacterales bacterium]|nr:GNAT family N-acetyltransferase [Ktedonobacterales bacterium]
MWRQWFKRQRSKAPEAVRSAGEGRQVAPTVTLRPMAEAEYESMRASLFEGYAQDISRAMDIPIEEARDAATQQITALLKDGLATEGHYLWKVMAVQDGSVGDLWTFVDPGKRRAFIYFIGIDERYRGKGYGKAAMLALEDAVRPKGADHIDLNVFGDNTTAIRLYEGLGYQPVAINMRKML